MRTVVITGVSGGFGRALAKEFSDAAWQVVGVGRSDLVEIVGLSTYVRSDPADLPSARRFWESLEVEDVCLVNNAGSYFSGRFLDQPDSSAEESMRGCYLTAVSMTRALMEHFNTATIVNIVSDSAIGPHASNSTYGSAKAAMAHFFGSLQAEHSGSRYRITNVYPGPISIDDSQSNGTSASELAAFVVQLASQSGSFYVKDCVIQPFKVQ